MVIRDKSKWWSVMILAGVLSACATTPGGDAQVAVDAVSQSTAEDEADGGIVDTFADASGDETTEPAGRSPLAAMAEARGDIDTAMTDIRMAEARGLLQPEANAWLERAVQAVEKGDATQASKLAREAGARAQTALDDYYADMAAQRIELLRRKYASKMSARQGMRLDSAEAALNAGKSEVALMLVSTLVEEVAPDATFAARSVAGGELTSVTVREGDTLSAIAARPEVYGNADMWPLILNANRDKFMRVDEVPVGVELVIPRNVSQAEVEKALAQAR